MRKAAALLRSNRATTALEVLSTALEALPGDKELQKLFNEADQHQSYQLRFIAQDLKHTLRIPLPLKRVQSTPDPDTFDKYRDTPPISIAILLQKYAALFLAESNIYTTNLYHDTPPICIAILLQKY